MGIIKGRWIRINCDNDAVYNGLSMKTGDYAGRTYTEALSQAVNDGWKKKKGKWYCPYCVWNNLM
jgi:hypothetical protein